MKKEITIEIEIPDVGANEEQIDEWIYFCLGYNGMMSGSNPLSQYDLEASDITM